MINSGWVWLGNFQHVCGLCVYMNCTLPMHVMPKGKDKESDVGGSASFVNVKPSDVGVVIDVVEDEKGGLKDASDVTERSGSRLGIWIYSLLYLIK